MLRTSKDFKFAPEEPAQGGKAQRVDAMDETRQLAALPEQIQTDARPKSHTLKCGIDAAQNVPTSESKLFSSFSSVVQVYQTVDE